MSASRNSGTATRNWKCRPCPSSRRSHCRPPPRQRWARGERFALEANALQHLAARQLHVHRAAECGRLFHGDAVPAEPRRSELRDGDDGSSGARFVRARFRRCVAADSAALDAFRCEPGRCAGDLVSRPLASRSPRVAARRRCACDRAVPRPRHELRLRRCRGTGRSARSVAATMRPGPSPSSSAGVARMPRRSRRWRWRTTSKCATQSPTRRSCCAANSAACSASVTRNASCRRYSMVTFSRMPYAQAFARGAVQEALLRRVDRRQAQHRRDRSDRRRCARGRALDAAGVNTPPRESRARVRELVALYRRTRYAVALPEAGVATLHIGRSAPAALASWIGAEGFAVYLTACNPYSRALTAAQNESRLARLRTRLCTLGARWLEGVAAIPQQTWAEPSLLVGGVPAAVCDALAFEFEQNASVGVDAFGTCALAHLPARLARRVRRGAGQSTGSSADRIATSRAWCCRAHGPLACARHARRHRPRPPRLARSARTSHSRATTSRYSARSDFALHCRRSGADRGRQRCGQVDPVAGAVGPARARATVTSHLNGEPLTLARLSPRSPCCRIRPA